jgi:hypothetical protein
MGFTDIDHALIFVRSGGFRRLTLDITPYAILFVPLVSLTSLGLLMLSDWRVSIVLLAIQYIGVGVLTALHWPLEMAVTKLIAGWMSGAVLGMAVISMPKLKEQLSSLSSVPNRQQRTPTRFGRPFHLVAAILVFLAAFAQITQLPRWIPDIRLEAAWGGLILIGMGLLKLGFNVHPLEITLALLTTLAGFEILLAALESAALVAGLLASVNLGIALAGAYLLVAPHMEETD